MKRIICLLLLFMTFSLFIACNNKEKDSYTIRWLNYDGTVLEIDENVKKGTLPEYNGATPTKPKEGDKEFKFLNWYKAVSKVTEDTDYTAQFQTVKKGNGMLGDDIADYAYQASQYIISEYIPGGSIINKALDLIWPSSAPQGPSLNDIKDDLDSMRSEISQQFRNVENAIKELSEAQTAMGIALENKIEEVGAKIEELVVNQTTISNKGSSFDSLLSTFQLTDRQLKAIHDDETMTDQSKAVQIAMLIGRNSQWTDSSNMYHQYLDFLNSLTGTNFGDLQGRDLLSIVYDRYYTTDLMFTGEVAYRASLYVDKIVYLAFEAYGVCMECLKAAQEVSCFTTDDIAKLDANSLSLYNNGQVSSPYSVVEGEISFLNDKVYKENFDQVSLTDRLNAFYAIDRNVFIYKGIEQIDLDNELLYWKYTENTDTHEGKFDDALGAYYGFGDAIYDLNSKMEYNAAAIETTFDYPTNLISYVQNLYKGSTIKDFLFMLGYHVSDYPDDTIFVISFKDDHGSSMYANGYSFSDNTYATSSPLIFTYSRHEAGGSMFLMYNFNVCMVTLKINSGN